MGDQLCVKKILNRLLKGLKLSLVNTETTVKIIWSSDYRDFSVKSKLIISLFQKYGFHVQSFLITDLSGLI